MAVCVNRRNPDHLFLYRASRLSDERLYRRIDYRGARYRRGREVLVYQMPVAMALAATGYGFLYGLWPISWIIIAAVFLYKLTVKTGQFEIIRSSV